MINFGILPQIDGGRGCRMPIIYIEKFNTYERQAMYSVSQEVIVYVVAGGLFIITVDWILKKFNLV